MKFVPNVLDLILTGIMVLIIISGVLRGFLREMLSLMFLGITFILSFIYHDHIGNLIFKKFVKESNLAKFLGFFSIWIFLFLISLAVTFLFKKKFSTEALKNNDRIAGGIIGFIPFGFGNDRGMVIMMIAISVLFALFFYFSNFWR